MPNLFFETAWPKNEIPDKYRMLEWDVQTCWNDDRSWFSYGQLDSTLPQSSIHGATSKWPVSGQAFQVAWQLHVL
jgi:hypothetical protein